MSKVYADNIAGITNLYALSHKGMREDQLPIPPTVEMMVETIRHAFVTRVNQEENQDMVDSLHYYRGLFEYLMANKLEGFALAPMFYSCVDEERLEEARKMFKETRPQLFTRMATTCAEELSALGICEEGIRRMREEGLTPRDAQKLMYAVNMDHVIDLAGCGRLLEEKPGWVNGAENICLLTLRVHDDYKNCLKMIQNMLSEQGLNETWVLTLAPERQEGRSGLVAHPQKPGHPFAGMKLINTRLPNGVERMFNLISAVSSRLDDSALGAMDEGRKRHLRMSLGKLTHIFAEFTKGSLSRKDRRALRLAYSGGGKALFRRLETLEMPEAAILLEKVNEVEHQRMHTGKHYRQQLKG